MKNAFALIGSLLLTFGVGALGAFATYPQIEGWYRGLAKSSLTPPDATFGIVWNILYALMALAAWLVWRERGKTLVKKPLLLYAFQLGLNFAWSFVFFGFHQLTFGLLIIVFLWFSIILTMIEFFRVKRAAGALLIPYLLWVSFASYLNLYTVLHN